MAPGLVQEAQARPQTVPPPPTEASRPATGGAADVVESIDRLVTATRDASGRQAQAVSDLAQAIREQKLRQQSMSDIALASAPATGVALVGFWVVHHFSVKRQRRDEFFKLVQAVHEQITLITNDAVKVWSADAGADKDQDILSRHLAARISKVSSQLATLERRQKSFVVTGEIVAFRRSVTADIEDDKRKANLARAAQIGLDGQLLQATIDTKYFDVFG